MITVKNFLQNKIGNQLFKVAFLVGISEKNNFKFTLPKNSIYAHYFENSINPVAAHYKYYFVEQDTCKNHPEVFQAPNHTLFTGDFQSEFYFKHCKDKVKEHMQFKEEIKTPTTEIINQIKKPLVSIHVSKKIQLGYYHQAVEIFPDCNFLVFSNDMPWCIQLFETEFPKTEMTFFNKRDSASLCAMTLCDHHIISTSAFSWWGAWLGKNDNKIVVSPAHDCNPQPCENWLSL